MPAIPHPTAAEGALLADLLGNSYLERWPEVVEIVSKPVSIAIVAAGFLGLVVGLLLRGRERSAPAAPAPGADGLEELRWRHEKLVLVERQQVEKQARLDAFAERFAQCPGEGERGLALRLFVLAERWREARQRVGSDLGRLKAVRDRLGELSGIDDRAGEAAAACRAMAETQVARLEEAREALRGLGDPLPSFEGELPGDSAGAAGFAALRKELVEWKGRALSLPSGWATCGGETDRRLREVLATVTVSAFDSLREVLLVDGAVTGSLGGDGEIDLAGSASAAIAALDRLAESVREAPAVPAVPAVPDVAPPPTLIEKATETSPAASDSAASAFGESAAVPPDPGFRDPAEFSLASLAPLVPRPLSRGFRDLTLGDADGPRDEPAKPNGSASGGAAPEAASDAASETDVSAPAAPASPEARGGRSLVLFCSNDVELWGRDVYRGARCRARAVEELPEWASWISIRRLDTGERVFAPFERSSLRGAQGAGPVGFNGSNELFYGARHLGLFSDACPNEVETRFTYGGWGFGHRAQGLASDVEKLQAAGWEGREIPADTVFEIVLHEDLPRPGALDRVLDGAGMRRSEPALHG